jgi:hypothetical protein
LFDFHCRFFNFRSIIFSDGVGVEWFDWGEGVVDIELLWRRKFGREINFSGAFQSFIVLLVLPGN